MVPNCSVPSWARCLLRSGFSVVPLKNNSKEPAIKWKDYTQQRMNIELVGDLFSKSSNIALVTGGISGLTVLDVDDMEKFKNFYPEIGNVETTIVKSPNGYHFWFQYEKDLKSRQYQGFGFDLKNENCLVTVPPSVKDGVFYSFLKVTKLGKMSEELKEKILKLQEGQKVKTNPQLDLILLRLKIARQLPDGTYRCYCPAHDDHEPSLDVGLRNGKIYLKCWAGCSEEDILKAVGLTKEDLTHVFQKENKKEEKRDTAIKRLLDFAMQLYYFQNQHGEAYVSIPVSGMLKNVRVESAFFKNYLQTEFFKRYRKPIYTQALYEAIQVLSGKALTEGKKHNTYIRIGKTDEGYELNLLNGKCVNITKGAIKISPPTCKFIEPANALPLPEPIINSDGWKKLRDLINTSDSDFSLALAWLVGCFNMDGELPILNITGEREGVGKTTASRIFKSCIDGSVNPLVPPPKSEDDLLVLCLNNHILAFDNLSKITESMSDALCRVSTGGALAKRKLFTDSEAVSYFVKNPIILNGIFLFPERRDLRRRVLTVELFKVTPKPIEQIMEQFNNCLPDILGFICLCVHTALKEDEKILKDYTDLASFVNFIARTRKVFPVPTDIFVNALKANRNSVSFQILSDDPVFQLVNELLASSSEWIGTAEELHRKLLERTTAIKNSKILGKHVRRLLSDFENAGIEVLFFKDKFRRKILFRKSEKINVSNVTNPKSLEFQQFTGDKRETLKDFHVTFLSPDNSLINKDFCQGDIRDMKKSILSKKESESSDINPDDVEILEED